MRPIPCDSDSVGFAGEDAAVLHHQVTKDRPVPRQVRVSGAFREVDIPEMHGRELAEQLSWHYH
jgi:hypothetical protein